MSKTLSHLKNLLTAELGNEFRTQIDMIVDRTANYVEEWIDVEKQKPEHREMVWAKVPIIREPFLYCYNEINGNWYHLSEGEWYLSEINPISYRQLNIKRQ